MLTQAQYFLRAGEQGRSIILSIVSAPPPIPDWPSQFNISPSEWNQVFRGSYWRGDDKLTRDRLDKWGFFLNSGIASAMEPYLLAARDYKQACRILPFVGYQNCSAQLRSGLSHQDPEIFLAASACLAKLHETSAVDDVLRLAESEPWNNIVVDLIGGLADLADERHISRISAIGEHFPKNPDVLAAIATAKARILSRINHRREDRK